MTWRKNTVKTALIVTSLIVVAVVCRILSHLSSIPLVADKALNVVRTLVYFGLFAGWGVSLRRRVVQVQVRKLLSIVVVLILVWLTLRAVKYYFGRNRYTLFVVRLLRSHDVYTGDRFARGALYRQKRRIPSAALRFSFAAAAAYHLGAYSYQRSASIRLSFSSVRRRVVRKRLLVRSRLCARSYSGSKLRRRGAYHDVCKKPLTAQQSRAMAPDRAFRVGGGARRVVRPTFRSGDGDRLGLSGFRMPCFRFFLRKLYSKRADSVQHALRRRFPRSRRLVDPHYRRRLRRQILHRG